MTNQIPDLGMWFADTFGKTQNLQSGHHLC